MCTQLVFVDEEIICDIPKLLVTASCHYISTVYLDPKQQQALYENGWKSVLCLHRGLSVSEIQLATKAWFREFSLAPNHLIIGTQTSGSSDRHHHKISIVRELALNRFRSCYVWAVICPLGHKFSYQNLSSALHKRFRQTVIPEAENNLLALFAQYRKLLVETLNKLADTPNFRPSDIASGL